MKLKSSILALCMAISGFSALAAGQYVRISTDATDLILKVADDNRLYQSYLGPRLLHQDEIDALPQLGFTTYESF